jgi:hypothetical protein
MELSAVVATGATVILALGGGGAIVVAFSAWLGRVWADRLMQKQQAEHEAKLEELRASLSARNSEQLQLLTRQLDIAIEAHQRETHDKFAIYRSVADIVSHILATFDRILAEGKPLVDGPDRLEQFNRERMRVYGYMAMLAPQSVLDANDALFDHLLVIIHQNQPYEWPKIRGLVLALLNEIRMDVGINKSSIEYRGRL